MNGKTILENVTSARLPGPCLASLAGLRRVDGITVLDQGEHAWVFWEKGDERALRALLPIPGVELYERRGNSWHRSGQILPTFGVPPTGERMPLDRAVTPSSFRVDIPHDDPLTLSPLSLVRDCRPRPTSAALCPMDRLARWAEWAPSSELEMIRGSIQRDQALLLGRNLPCWTGSTRYWGCRVLVPVGFELRPALHEDSLLETLGSSGDEIFRLIPETEGLVVEAIPLDSFRFLSRAGVRLAMGAGIS